MPKVIDAARVTTKDGAVWRRCTRCDTLAALSPDAERCLTCAAASYSTVSSSVRFTGAELDAARAELADLCRPDASELDRLRTTNAYLAGYLGSAVSRVAAGSNDPSLRHAAALYAVSCEREATR